MFADSCFLNAQVINGVFEIKMRLFEEKINKLRFRQNLIIGLHFALIAMAVFVISFQLFFVIFIGSVNNLQGLFLFAQALKIILFLLFVFLALQAFRRKRSKLQIARQLDDFNQDKTDTYQNALELQSEQIEAEILARILARADQKAEGQIIKTETHFLSPIWKIVILVYLASALIFSLNPQKYIEARSFFNQRSIPEMQHKDFVELEPGNISVTRSSRVTIQIIDPEPQTEHKLFYRIEENWREELMIDHRKTFDNLDYSLDYYVKTPYAVSDTFRLEVFELPVITNIDVRYDFPSYTGMKPEIEKQASGNIRALSGTQIRLDIDANNPIESGRIIFSSGEFKDLERTGRSSFRIDFRLLENGSYHFNLEDILGNQARKLTKSLTAVRDRYPELRITHPGQDTLLTQNMLLPLRLTASDDFGLQDLQLFYQVNRGKVDSLYIQRSIPGSSLNLEYIFDLGDLVLIPGDVVTYWMQIADNSPYHQTTESGRFLARFPSIEEIYREIEKKEEEKSTVLKETLERSEQLQQEFEKKRFELLRKEEPDWQDKKDIESILEKQSAMNKDIEDIVEDFRNMIEKYEDNQALSKETIEKMEKIRQLMEEISNEELQKAMEKLQESMEKLDPDVLKKAMENFKFSMEEFTKKLDQTIQLMEDIKKEQAMQKALEIAEEMEEMQSVLNEKTEQEDSSFEHLASQQQDIAQKLENLQKQLTETQKMLDAEKDADIMQAMKELKDQMAQDSLGQDLEKAQKSLSKLEKQDAMQSQQNAQEKMKSMRKKLQEMQSMMAAGSLADIGDALQKAIRRLLIFSQLHETSQQSFGNDPYAILSDQIANFEGINLSLNDLFNTPMIFLALGPKFLYDANFTISNYREMFNYINEAQVSKVKNYLSDIQKGINLMIYDLMQAASNLQQGGGSGGNMQGLMQSLQQMGQEQMAMNMMTQSLMQQMGQSGQMTQEMRSQAQRLAQDEERLAENLKRLIQTDQEAQKQTSALNQIIDDLEAISHDLKRGRIDQELIDKQQRILSRLLDAQKSIHKREFSEKRKAEISDIELWDLPDNIKLEFDNLKRKALLNEDLESYPKEYRELIREYLRLLNEKVE